MAMEGFTEGEFVELGAGFEKKWESIGVGRESGTGGEEEEGEVWGGGLEVAMDDGVAGERAWGGGVGEDGEGVVHEAAVGAEGDDLAGEEGGAAMLGFYHLGVDLVEVSEGGAALEEGESGDAAVGHFVVAKKERFELRMFLRQL